MGTEMHFIEHGNRVAVSMASVFDVSLPLLGLVVGMVRNLKERERSI